MTAAARVHIAERGRDPRAYAVLATGGGGPVHAAALARKLGARRVICPPSAGVASALGLIMAPARIDRVATVGFRLEDGDLARLEAELRRLETEALALVADTGVTAAGAGVVRLADGRFVGQGFDLVVPLPEGPYDRVEAGRMRQRLAIAFETAYREKFARTPPKVAIEFVSIRVSVTAPVAETAVVSDFGEAGHSDPQTHRRVRIEGGGAGGEAIELAIYARTALRPGARFNGPALVEEESSTLVIPAGAVAEVRPSGSILVTLT
jgi:N-methylhydantoinase A